MGGQAGVRAGADPTDEALERIAFDRNREAVAINCVNPLDLDSVDQIHVVGGSPQAIPTEHDLV